MKTLNLGRLSLAALCLASPFALFGGWWESSEQRKKIDLGSLGGPEFDTVATGINNRGQVVGWSSKHSFLWEKGKMTDIGIFSAYNVASGINDYGQVVGWYAHSNNVQRAFLWDKGKVTDLEGLCGLNSYAAAINNHGQIVEQLQHVIRRGTPPCGKTAS